MAFLSFAVGSCGPGQFGVLSGLDFIQLAGALLIPLGAVVLVFVVTRRYPTDTLRWTSHRIVTALASPFVLPCALALLAAGVLLFGVSIFVTPAGAADCAALGPAALLLTLTGAMLSGLAVGVKRQAGWVVLATFFALDLWIVFGMVMMHLESNPAAPDPMLLLAFMMHAVCMYLTMTWAFHARNLSTMGQIRAGEAGRSIGAVWVFLAAYILVGFFQREQGPFDSAAGGAVLSALTLSALALTMGSGYTKYREVMAEEQAGRS